ncbi:MAG: ScpA family protein [Patescibacteria group bacterium]
MPEDFKVKVGDFEGPLELVLDLIEKRKLHISDLSLSQVADEFIEHIKSFEEFPMSDSADFILVASTLLLIKSKSLLPNLPLTEEEQGSIEDLESRLISYKKYKELSGGLSKIFGNFLYFARENKKANVVFSPTSDISLSSLKSALAEVLKNMPQKIEKLPKVVVQKIISLEEMIDKLTERIKTSIKMSFKNFSHSTSSGRAGMEKEEKINIIVGFLAMLELVKRGAVRASQEEHFKDIEIESEELGTPNY